MEKPKYGYGFKHKETGALSLVLFLGTGDSLANYEVVSDEEYNRIVAELDEQAKQAVPM